jgi:hypothetical protein
VSDPDRSSPPAPRAGSQLRFQFRKQAELKSGQWCLLAPLQAGNEIKFAMFRRKAFEIAGNQAEKFRRS